MEYTEKGQEPSAEDEPLVYGAEKKRGGAWTFTRRGFLGLAAAAAA
jgi:hypothetical protein